ncbi:hypothetical protein MNBD_ALPHA04-707 [hydrothermal vent metagenome]|uniref:Glycosyl transferase family 1 domain-containing protein n=1 Tax=hydrothermal vent metagenome TaxID=652676 RepID=A0A3B0RE61_9ZZZZ
MENETDIRFITRKWAPAMGGMETYCLRLTEEMAKTQKLDIIALPGKSNGDVPSAFSLIWFGLKTAVRLLFTKPAKIVHIGDVASWPLGWIASLRHPASKIILSAHGSDLNFATGQGLAARLYAGYISLATKLLPGATLIANSGWIADLADQQGFGKIVTVPLATDVKALQAPNSHNGCLFFAGRIMPSKGLSYLVEKVLPLLPNPPKIRVAGTVWDEQEGRILKSPLVEYLGLLAPDQLVKEYGAALCAVVPSLTKEGFGLVAAEAAACGAVVLASDHSGLAEVVTEDIGFVAAVDDPQTWAATIMKIHDWPDEKRAKFIASSMRTAQDRYSWDRVARDTIAAY